MTLALYSLAVAALLLISVMSAITLTTILRLRLGRPQALALSAQEVPPDAREAVAPGLAQLVEMGFAHPAALRMVGQIVAGQPVPQHGLVLTHGKLPAAGYVVQTLVPDRSRHFTLYFVSRTRNGRTLVTRNRSSATGPLPLPDVTTLDCWLPTWPALWQAHRQKMKALEGDPANWQNLDAAAWIEAGAAAEAAAFNERVKRGELLEEGAGSWRFSLPCALRMLGRAWAAFIPASRGMVGDGPATAARPAAGAADDAAIDSVARQVQTYERDSLMRQTRSGSNGAKWLLFFVTAVAAAASFGLTVDLSLVPALLSVLLFHELGHLAAMRWAGYRDLKVFFLPFIGAAVSGRHEHPTARQELVVLFAGPVPGLLLGIAGLLWLPPDLPLSAWWHSCAVLAVTLNAFNLLPLHPLDGGKIFEILLLGRWPWLAFAGRVLGLAAFAGLALTMDSDAARAAMGGLVLLMALGLAHQRREAQLAAAVRTAGPWGGLSRAEALAALFTAMDRLGLAARPWSDQRLLAAALLPALTRARLRRRDRAGGLAVYAFFLLLPVLVLVGSLWNSRGASDPTALAATARAASALPPALDADLPAQQGAEIDRLFAELKTRVMREPEPGRRWSLLAAEFASAVENQQALDPAHLPSAMALLQEAQRLAPTLPDPVAKRAAAAFWQAQMTPDDADRQRQLEAVMGLYDDPAAAAADAGPLASAAIDWLYSTRSDPAQRAARIDKTLSRLGPHASAQQLQTMRGFKLDQLLAEGDGATALRLAREWHDALLDSPDIDHRVLAAQLVVDTELAAAGAAAALRTLDEVLQPLDSLPAGRASGVDALRRTGLWLAEAAGRPDWQRQQVQRLAAPPEAGVGLPWWMGPLLWLQSGDRGAPATLTQLEHAHWRGDAAAAQQVAASLRQQRPGFAVRLHSPVAEAGALSAARMTLVTAGRKALCERYGLRVTMDR
ncbi:metalloprotease [Aquabacterium sp.]|uniref:metalloprotease n=1 Tax=Aquabacterium sp. TaxID=1872578 RepID=UPI002CF4A945|nr:site-2 protease family protein [Aquabacterium sp.]HSW05636.1 site-2 protease family protein [Aquabacterium sp.]